MRHAARTDLTHKEIRQALREVGYTVVDTSQLGEGYPDLTVIGQDGRVFLVEVKTLANMRAEKIANEVLFMIKLVNPIYRVASTPEQAIEILRGVSTETH